MIWLDGLDIPLVRELMRVSPNIEMIGGVPTTRPPEMRRALGRIFALRDTSVPPEIPYSAIHLLLARPCSMQQARIRIPMMPI